MSDLSRSLVAAAGKAVYDEVQKWPLPSEPWLRAGQVGALGATQADVGRAAVVAVLETLAASVADQPVELADLTKQGQLYNSGKQYVVDLMRRLAVEVKTEGR